MKLAISQSNAIKNINKRCLEFNYILTRNFIYKDGNSRIYLKCLKDNYEWNTSYKHFIYSKSGCPKCCENVVDIKEVNNKINKKCLEFNYELTKDFIYSNGCSILYLKCLKDNYEWNTSYKHFINSNTGCPKCGGKLRLTQEEAENRIHKRCLDFNYELTKDFIYKNAKTKICLKCNKDNYEWNISYADFIIKKTCCPKCKKVLKPTQEEAEKKVELFCKNNNYTLINSFKYISAMKTYLNLECNKDKHIWTVSYFSFVERKTGCPKCGISIRNETKIKKYGEIWKNHIPSYNPNSIIYLDMISEKLGLPIQHALNGGEKKFVRYWVDGYIEQYNICIEWDEQGHNSKRQKEKDIVREQYLIENYNCHFVRINQKEFLNDINNHIDIIVEKINNIINLK